MARAAEIRSKRVTVALTEDVYAAVKECAAYAGVSINAWLAVVIGQTARTQIDSRRAILAAAQSAVGEALDVTALERAMLAEQEAENES